MHLFTFNPEWIKPKKNNHSLQVFYDGSCGLCHLFIKFTLSENVNNTQFVFIPLQGKVFQELAKLKGIKCLPDSIVVYDPEARILFYKSKAIIQILENLGGVWGLSAYLLKLLPLSLGNILYDMIAKKRYKIFKRAHHPCPLLPQEWKQFVLMD